MCTGLGQAGSALGSSPPASPAAGPSGLWGARPRPKRGGPAGAGAAGRQARVTAWSAGDRAWTQRGLSTWEHTWGGGLGHQLLAGLLISPQPQAGFALSSQNLSPDEIFHVIVAPCYDKKLEALREDLPTASHGSRGADCVLTSGEGWAGRVRLGPLAGRPLRSRQDSGGFDCREVGGSAPAARRPV